MDSAVIAVHVMQHRQLVTIEGESDDESISVICKWFHLFLYFPGEDQYAVELNELNCQTIDSINRSSEQKYEHKWRFGEGSTQ